MTIKQSRGWIITIPEHDHTREEIIESLGVYTSLVGQLEQGHQTGYRHWQLYIEHKTPISFQTLKNKLPRAHIEPRRGSKAQAYAYCMKEDSRIDDQDPIILGEIDLTDHSGRRSDLSQIRDRILQGGTSEEIMMDSSTSAWRYPHLVDRLVHARDTTLHDQGNIRKIQVEYYFGDPGVGKTQWAWNNTHHFTDTYRVTEYSNPFDEYRGQKTLILDEFTGDISLSTMLNLLDVYPCVLPARYKNKYACYTRVIILSNITPEQCYSWETTTRQEAFLRRIHTVKHVKRQGSNLSMEEYIPKIIHHSWLP